MELKFEGGRFCFEQYCDTDAHFEEVRQVSSQTYAKVPVCEDHTREFTVAPDSAGASRES